LIVVVAFEGFEAKFYHRAVLEVIRLENSAVGLDVDLGACQL
jgi:hypothetical protein